MGYKKDDPCLEKAFDDERLFILMTRDVVAPKVVVEWIKESLEIQPPEKLHEALDCAIEMSKMNASFNGQGRKRREKTRKLIQEIEKQSSKS